MPRRKNAGSADSSPAPTTPPAAADASYFTEIEAHFAMRRGTPFVVSAKDWALMKEWAAHGIPLPVVVEAIDAVFEKNESSGRRKVISSLSYCRHAVKEIWHDRKELQVGEGGIVPEEAPLAALELLAAELASSSVPEVSGYAETLRSLSREKSVPRVEERLIELEREMIDAVLAAAPAEEREAVRHEVVRALGDTSKLDAGTRARTEEANRRRIVRERYGVPRLTLFR